MQKKKYFNPLIKFSIRTAAAAVLIISAGNYNGIHSASDDKEFGLLMDKAQKQISAAEWSPLVKTAARLCTLKPDNIWANYYMGLAQTNSGDSAGGEVWLKRAIAIDSSIFWPQYILFYSYLNRGKPEMHTQAQIVMERITPELVKSNPMDIRNFYAAYSGLLINNTDIKKAQTVLKKGTAFFPKDPVLKSQYAFTFFRRDMKTWERLSRETLTLIPKEQQKAYGTYRLPLRGERIKVHQGNNEGVTHLGLLNGYDWDFVVVDDTGAYGKDNSKKEGHYIFGDEVYAAADGVVYFVHDTSPDTEPMKNHPAAAPNRIVIQHSNGEYTSYIHLMKGSAAVKPGDTVKGGQEIAKVGSSGSSVDFPHLHFGVNRDGHSVEAKLTGFETVSGGKSKTSGPRVPQKNDIMRSR